MSSLAVPPFMSLAIESISGWRGFPNAEDLVSIPTTIVYMGSVFRLHTIQLILHCILHYMLNKDYVTSAAILLRCATKDRN